jgi:hypothetical protein
VLPEPMLARADHLPRGDYAFDVKWDGFRALVSTEEDGYACAAAQGGRPAEVRPSSWSETTVSQGRW